MTTNTQASSKTVRRGRGVGLASVRKEQFSSVRTPPRTQATRISRRTTRSWLIYNVSTISRHGHLVSSPRFSSVPGTTSLPHVSYLDGASLARAKNWLRGPWAENQPNLCFRQKHTSTLTVYY